MVEKQNKGETVMDKVKEKGVFLNPYVMQMDKFADSFDPICQKHFLHWKDIKVLCQKKSLKICFGM